MRLQWDQKQSFTTTREFFIAWKTGRIWPQFPNYGASGTRRDSLYGFLILFHRENTVSDLHEIPCQTASRPPSTFIHSTESAQVSGLNWPPRASLSLLYIRNSFLNLTFLRTSNTFAHCTTCSDAYDSQETSVNVEPCRSRRVAQSNDNGIQGCCLYNISSIVVSQLWKSPSLRKAEQL